MTTDVLGALLTDLDQPAPTVNDGPLPTLPPERGRRRRGLKVEPSFVTKPADAGVTVAAARVMINAAMRAYIDLAQPAHALLISVPPGVGKTYAAVRLAEACARWGMRVLYAGPRHAFFLDVLRCAEHPEWWYEWLPRQLEDENTGKVETCRHAPHMASWLARGYDAMDYCSSVCGWDYVNNTCGYHAQKEQTEPIIFGQHQHVVGGHILMESFDVMIGDEYPLGVFLHEWLIPARSTICR